MDYIQLLFAMRSSFASLILIVQIHARNSRQIINFHSSFTIFNPPIFISVEVCTGTYWLNTLLPLYQINRLWVSYTRRSHQRCLLGGINGGKKRMQEIYNFRTLGGNIYIWGKIGVLQVRESRQYCEWLWHDFHITGFYLFPCLSFLRAKFAFL